VLNEAGLKPAKPTSAAVDPYEKQTQPTTKPTVGQTQSKSILGAQEQAIESLAKELGAIVEQQARDWNRGDIDAFMKAYWPSEELTFSSGGDVERGWEGTRARYKRRYPDRQTMGQVTFSELEVQPLDDNAALMLGRWHLEREQPVGGAFTLVWKKFDGRWLIVHDHTSVKER
jgi:beta-aspartyl-peptidase (threonine type)